ncbi:MAG: DUF885 family protein [Armatimonadota bacterium]
MEPQAAQTRAPALAAGLDAFFDWYYRTYPVNATFIGVHDHDGRLPDYSDGGIGDALAGITFLQQRLRDLPPEPLTEAESLDRKLVDGFLDIQRWEYASTHFHRGNPCVFTGEAAFGVIALFLRPFAPFPTRMEAALERMMAIPTLLAQGRHVRRAPRAWTERAIRECAGALAFFQGGVEILIREEGIEHPGFRAAVSTAAAAFRDFQDYLETDLLRHPADDYACGGDALDLLLRRGHFLDMDAAAVRGLAEEHMATCEAHLETHASGLGATSWREALALLPDRHPTVAQYYARYTNVWQDARNAAETRGLVTWPDYPIRYVPQPVWAREAVPHLYFLFYRSPSSFDRLPMVDYLVTPIDPDMPPEEQTRRLRATNDSVITLNHVVHHGGLGHHVQNWYAFRAASRVGQVAAVDCAGRIAMYCGGTMAEGWACYATDLMDEIGFLEPLERLAQAHTRLRIAARALVDVKLHTCEWTLEEAAACYRDRVGMSPDAAHAEAVKNSMFPGTALMYLVGTEQIHRLRRDLAARRPGFDLRRFHDRFLSYGSVPVSLICAAMRES